MPTKRIHTWWQLRALYWRVLRSFTILFCRSIACRVVGQQMVIIALYEHIGDIIACEPIIKHIKDKHPNTAITWMINKQYAELLSQHASVAHIQKLASLSEWILLKKLLVKYLPTRIIDLHIDERRCSRYGFKVKQPGMEHYTNFSRKSLLQSFSSFAGLGELTDAPAFYLDKSAKDVTIPGAYIVFHTQTNSFEKDWTAEKWSQLCRLLNNDGYYVVEVGIAKRVNDANRLYIDYTGKRSLQNIANLINDCTFFVGLDSAFAHMANALQKPGCILMGNYKKGQLVYDRFNPFTGKYSDSSYIMYNENGPAAAIEVDKVYAKTIAGITLHSGMNTAAASPGKMIFA